VDVGKQLLQARQRRNLALVDISRNTKIPLHTLEAIERNDIEHLPPSFFTRAFVRTYAKEVGVNPDEILDRVEPDLGETENVPPPPAEAGEPTSSRALFVLLALLGTCGLLYLQFHSAPAPAVPRAADVRPTPLVDRAEVAAPILAQNAVDVEFQIKSHGGCLVAVTADGRPVVSQVLDSGQPITVKARGELVLRVGDTAACAPVEKPAGTTRVVRRSSAGGPVDATSVGPVAPTAPVTNAAADDPATASSSRAEPLPRTSDVDITPPDPIPSPAAR
jgi:cytoskeletal protein RodZ